MRKTNPILFFLLGVFCFQGGMSFAAVNAPTPVKERDLVQEMIDRESQKSPEVVLGRHFTAELKVSGDRGFSSPGLEAGLGYRLGLFGFDIKGFYKKTTYDSIRAKLDGDQYSTGIYGHHAGLEENRARFATDAWNYFGFEPGVSVESKFFPESLELFTERARFGVMLGRFNDEINQLGFNGYLFTTEIAIIRQWKTGSRYSLTAALFWKSGHLVNRDDGLLASDRNLPVTWLGTSFGLQYSF